MDRLKEVQVGTSRLGCQTRSQGLETMEPSLEETQRGDSLPLEHMGEDLGSIREDHEETGTREVDTATSPGRAPHDCKKNGRDLVFEELVKTLQVMQEKLKELKEKGPSSSSHKLCKTNMLSSFTGIGKAHKVKDFLVELELYFKLKRYLKKTRSILR